MESNTWVEQMLEVARIGNPVGNVLDLYSVSPDEAGSLQQQPITVLAVHIEPCIFPSYGYSKIVPKDLNPILFAPWVLRDRVLSLIESLYALMPKLPVDNVPSLLFEEVPIGICERDRDLGRIEFRMDVIDEIEHWKKFSTHACVQNVEVNVASVKSQDFRLNSVIGKLVARALLEITEVTNVDAVVQMCSRIFTSKMGKMMNFFDGYPDTSESNATVSSSSGCDAMVFAANIWSDEMKAYVLETVGHPVITLANYAQTCICECNCDAILNRRRSGKMKDTTRVFHNSSPAAMATPPDPLTFNAFHFKECTWFMHQSIIVGTEIACVAGEKACIDENIKICREIQQSGDRNCIEPKYRMKFGCVSEVHRAQSKEGCISEHCYCSLAAWRRAVRIKEDVVEKFTCPHSMGDWSSVNSAAHGSANSSSSAPVVFEATSLQPNSSSDISGFVPSACAMVATSADLDPSSDPTATSASKRPGSKLAKRRDRYLDTQHLVDMKMPIISAFPNIDFWDAHTYRIMCVNTPPSSSTLLFLAVNGAMDICGAAYEADIRRHEATEVGASSSDAAASSQSNTNMTTSSDCGDETQGTSGEVDGSASIATADAAHDLALEEALEEYLAYLANEQPGPSHAPAAYSSSLSTMEYATHRASYSSASMIDSSSDASPFHGEQTDNDNGSTEPRCEEARIYGPGIVTS
jgi:hypothetical protein